MWLGLQRFVGLDDSRCYFQMRQLLATASSSAPWTLGFTCESEITPLYLRFARAEVAQSNNLKSNL
jgi:hypothetical protein